MLVGMVIGWWARIGWNGRSGATHTPPKRSPINGNLLSQSWWLKFPSFTKTAGQQNAVCFLHVTGRYWEISVRPEKLWQNFCAFVCKWMVCGCNATHLVLWSANRGAFHSTHDRHGRWANKMDTKKRGTALLKQVSVSLSIAAWPNHHVARKGRLFEQMRLHEFGIS